MTTLKIALIFVCHFFCAFFAGMETGIISVNRLRLVHLARGGDKRASLIAEYIRDPDRLLGTMLVGSNIVSVAISTLAAALAGDLWGSSGLGISSAVSTLTILVFGEFLPKAWFSSRPLQRCLPFARFLRGVEILLLPLSKLMLFVTGLFTGGAKNSSTGGKMVTREHLQWLARNSEAGGQISPLESLMISRVLALQTKTAADVMAPLSSVSVLSDSATLGDVSALVGKTGHNKFPVVDGATGMCRGVLYVRDVLARISGNPGDKVMDFVRKPFYLRHDTRADDILPHLRRHGQRLAIVRNASGRQLGIVTIDGILRIIVGNLPRDTTGERSADKDAAIVYNAAGKEVQ